MIVRPNIFNIATKELSHDSAITWLMQWAHPDAESLDAEIHACGSALLQVFLQGVNNDSKITAVEARRQWHNIDIWVKVYFEDGEKYFFIIENKIFADEHSNQLVRYKEIASEWAEKNGFKLGCFFVKIGSQPVNIMNGISEKGYKIIDRNLILDNLNKVENTKNSLIIDYKEFLKGIEDEHQAYNTLTIDEWEGWQWVGFYQFVEKQIHVINWHFVNNPSGGFWNLLLNWEQWQDVPVYMQIEQGKLCYKIALGADQTGIDDAKTSLNQIQDFVHSKLLEYAHENGVSEIRRPHRHVHNGNYRTFAIIEREIWLGKDDDVIDKDKVVANLSRLLSFHNKFISHLNMFSYEDAGLTVEYIVQETV